MAPNRPAARTRIQKTLTKTKSADAAYAALRAFAERIGVDQPASTADLPKLAEADNLLDFLRGLKAPPRSLLRHRKAATGKGPVAGGTKPTAPVDATYVGAKVCATCHASQAEAFSHTLMGKIGKTQKGKFDCENCHGPGSAHVKAGGGRGVGGIISFRPEDLSRTAEENNAICLDLPREAADRTNWHGSTHDERGLMCTQLPHGHEERVAQVPIEDGIPARHLLPVPQEQARRDVALVTHARARRQGHVLGLP